MTSPTSSVDKPLSENPSLGGKARAKALTQNERTSIASRAASERWNRELPRATHSGEIVIGDKRIACAVLETGKRLLTQETFLTAIGRAGKAKGGTGSFTVDGLPPFLAADNLSPFISDDLRQSTTPVFFRSDKGIRGAGYDAMLLPGVCEVYLQFRDECHAAGIDVPTSQRHIVAACDLLMRGLARVGIVALVDEATGYQADRARDELSKILEAYIVEELRPWIRTFPEEFFRQIYRIHGWQFRRGSTKRPAYVGRFINKHIYEHLPLGVLPKLRELNPVIERGYRRHKHFQFLTANTGNPHLDKQISTVTTLMRTSRSKEEFNNLFDRAFAAHYQEKMPLIVDVPAALPA
jgi:hypothetical protein